MADSVSYWLAYDGFLNSHRFRVTCYTNMYETGLLTEYGTVKYKRMQGEILATIRPKGKSPIRLRFQEDDNNEQILLSQLVFWYSQSLFLAVPDINSQGQNIDPLF